MKEVIEYTKFLVFILMIATLVALWFILMICPFILFIETNSILWFLLYLVYGFFFFKYSDN